MSAFCARPPDGGGSLRGQVGREHSAERAQRHVAGCRGLEQRSGDLVLLRRAHVLEATGGEQLAHAVLPDLVDHARGEALRLLLREGAVLRQLTRRWPRRSGSTRSLTARVEEGEVVLDRRVVRLALGGGEGPREQAGGQVVLAQTHR